jgi:indole-3-glycerol phosphate synthase
MDFLTQIIAKKRVRVLQAKGAIGDRAEAKMLAQAIRVRHKAKPHALSAAISDRTRLNVVAEIKRASPSKGVIRKSVEPALLAHCYEEEGAAAISVLTEEDCFHGSLEDLCAVRRSVRLPVLRKDFIFDKFQVYESAAAGADALVLIVAALRDDQLVRLRQIAEDDLHMDALVEVHTQTEMERALKCGATLIGVNNRNLHTFEVSLDTSVALAQNVPDEVLLISESGLRNASDLSRLRGLGYDAFLIGETLLRADEPGTALQTLFRQYRQKDKVILSTGRP